MTLIEKVEAILTAGILKQWEKERAEYGHVNTPSGEWVPHKDVPQWRLWDLTHEPKSFSFKDGDGRFEWANKWGDGRKPEDQPEHGIVYGDWNITSRGTDSEIESLGFEVDWQDQVQTCDDCMSLLPSDEPLANAYSGPAGRDGWICRCAECVDWGEVLEGLENKSSGCVNTMQCSDEKMEEFGYRLIPGEYYAGIRESSTDNDPGKIMKALRKKGHKRIVFVVDTGDMFEARYRAWEKVEESGVEDEILP